MVKLVPMCLVVDLVPPLTVIVRICPMSKAWTATLALASYVSFPVPLMFKLLIVVLDFSS
jgi:hypothetical protein